MPMRVNWVPLALLGLLLGAPPGADAQGSPYNLKYRSGQTVQPVFEGWSKNPDGSFALHFGYFNRNHLEEVQVPVGPDNYFEPGEVDVGQPTYFYPRAHRRVFSFTVPSDFGDRQVVWNLSVRGEGLRAVGWLDPTWQTAADAVGGRRFSEEAAQNTAPEIAVAAPSSVTVQTGTTLTAQVSDDGLPVQREPNPDRGPGSNAPPSLEADPDALEAPHNVPAVPNRKGSATRGPRVRGLRVSWIVWRGPGAVTFAPASTVAVEDGQAAVTATFTIPGDYVLRATANDDRLTAEHDVTVTVR